MRLANLSLFILVILCSQGAFAQPAARTGLLQKLLDLPAPAPFDPPEATPKKPAERPVDFRDEENIPPDDAPIEDLLDYWARPYIGLYTARYIPKPSEKTIERILEACEENPNITSNYLSILPTTPEAVEAIKKIYDKQMENPAGRGYGNQNLQTWLKFNSKLYLDELIREANQIKDIDNYVPNKSQFVLRALGSVDWESAVPILERLENDATNPYSATLAKWVKYRHALDTGDSSTENEYREHLKKIVADKKAQWALRDLAMDSLTHSPGWDGREEWYLSLLEDETLHTIQDNGYTGLTTLMRQSPRKIWIGKMIDLVASKNPTVRTAAARNLMEMFTAGKTEILKALLPWLADPGWAKESRDKERTSLIRVLGTTRVPEAVPGLISVVTNEPDLRMGAAEALANYKDPRAIPALKTILASVESPRERNTFIVALMACGGFSDDEQMAALETYIVFSLSETGQQQYQDYLNQYNGGVSVIPVQGASRAAAPAVPVDINIGLYLSRITEPHEGLVTKAIDRLKILRTTNQPAADALAEIMLQWTGPAIYKEHLRKIRAGENDIDSVITVLARREAILEALPGEITSLRNSSGTARAIGSCIANDQPEYGAILEQDDAEAQTALLGCARLLRIRFPVGGIAPFLDSRDKLLALAAERYLESEDSLDARKLVLDKNKGTIMLLGARTAFVPDAKITYDPQALGMLFTSVAGRGSYRMIGHNTLEKKEEALRKGLAADPSITNIFAILTSTPAGHMVIRIYKDRVVYTYYENEARYRERTLTTKEFESFRHLLISGNIDGLKPQLGCYGECPSREFVMFGKEGGRRIFFEHYVQNQALAKLVDTFENYQKGESSLHYHLADKVTGLEVVFADDKYPVKTVWKKGDDLRLLIEDKARGEEIVNEMQEKIEAAREAKPDDDDDETAWRARYRMEQQMRLDALFAGFSWRRLEKGRPEAFAAQPPEVPILYDATQVKQTPDIQSSPRARQVRSGNTEIRVGDDRGLFRTAPGQEPVKFKEGTYSSPMVSADGKWIFAVNQESEPEETKSLVRINLQTGREYKIALPPADAILPAAFAYSHNKMLVYRGRMKNYYGMDVERVYSVKNYPGLIADTPMVPEYYLLDPVSGAIQSVKGEFRPLEDQTYRPLQPTGNASEFWAAIYDKKTRSTMIGRYSDKTFTFKPVLSLPDIELNSMDIWVDGPGGKVYFVYEGHLLSLPMK